MGESPRAAQETSGNMGSAERVASLFITTGELHGAIQVSLRARTVDAGYGCWEWQGPRDTGGYAVCYVPEFGNQWLAHRLSYALAIGPIPEGMFVCHRCDNRLCINPDHLFLGTHQDNMDDMVRKGRQAKHGQSAHCLKGHAKEQYGGRWRCRECHSASRRRCRKVSLMAKAPVHRVVTNEDAREWVRVMPAWMKDY